MFLLNRPPYKYDFHSGGLAHYQGFLNLLKSLEATQEPQQLAESFSAQPVLIYSNQISHKHTWVTTTRNELNFNAIKIFHYITLFYPLF